MPQFDPAVVAPQLVWLVITFGVLYFLMARVVLPKIGLVLEEREERVADDLDQAENYKRDAAEVKERLEEALKEARSESLKAVQEAREKVQAEVDKKLAALEAKLAEESEAAEAEIKAEKKRAIAELGPVAEEACKAMVEKLIGEVPEREVEAAVAHELDARRSA